MSTQIMKKRLHRLGEKSACRQAGITQIGWVVMGAMALFLLCLVAVGETQEGKEKIKTTTASKEVQGEVSGIGKDSISVVYMRDEKKRIEYEMLLPIEKDIRLVHKQRLDQINVGDIVRVQYEEVTEEYEEGPRSSRKAKVISFVKPAPQKPEQTAPESESLTIKGIKGQ